MTKMALLMERVQVIKPNQLVNKFFIYLRLLGGRE
jgi:hypothetical protein